MGSGVVQIDNRAIKLSNTDKILFPQGRITKGDLIDYYSRVAPVMLPHIKDRPLTMQRFVHGIVDEGFYQKDASDYFPRWIKRIAIEKKEGGITRYVVCNDAATLVYLANQASIVQHVWLSKINKLNYPDRMIFDLDPSGTANFALIRWTAKEIKRLLDSIDLTSFIMTTGSRGVHIVIPLKPVHTYDEVKDFAYRVAELLVQQYPDKLTLEMRKAKRGNKIFLDVLRNTYGHHGVAPYSVRAKEGAPIATPISWNELSTVRPQKFTIKNIFRRLGRKQDPWAQIDTYAQALTLACKKLNYKKENR